MVSDPRLTDRLWYVFAISSVITVAVLAISPVKDYFREYRSYQNAYRKLLIDTAGSARELRAAESQAVAIRQYWLEDLGNHVDRCTSCHLGVDNPRMAQAQEPFRAHPITPHTPGEFQQFGCTVCHGGQGRATSLAEAHGEVPDWDRPLLPVRYTEASCGRCHSGESVPEASLLSAGRSLLARAGCRGCHTIPGSEVWTSEAPDLDGLSQKTSPEWLKAWLRSPRDLRPATWMPAFRLDVEEIDDLAAFLWSLPAAAGTTLEPEVEAPQGDSERGRTLFGQSRCVSCHTIEGRGNGSAPELSGIGSKVNRRWLMAFLRNPKAFQPQTRMSRYDFTEQDLLDLSQYMMEELVDPSALSGGAPFRPAEKSVRAGERVYKKYGCGGCHRIAGRGDLAPIGPDLAGVGDKAVGLLDFGARHDLPRNVPAWLSAKVADPGSFRENLKMPDFGFTPEQVQQLVTALLSLSAEPVPPAFQVRTREVDYEPPGRFGSLTREYACMSCHQIHGKGGDISKAPLTFEGSRVRRDWLVDYLLRPSTIRPILTDRMIPLLMPEETVRFMADFIENVYVDNEIPGEIFPGGLPADGVKRGRKLFFERYGCQSCHSLEGRGGYFGPTLDGAGERLESGWVVWWLRGPHRWQPDVRCPDYGLDEDDSRDLAAFVVSIPPVRPHATAREGGGS